MCKVLADVSLFWFFMLDHVIFLGRMKAITDMRWKMISGLLCDYMWGLEIIFGVSASVIEIKILQENLRKIRKQEITFVVIKILIKNQDDQKTEVDKIKKQVRSQQLDIIKNLLDAPVVVHFTQPQLVGPGVAGFLGTLTSLYGVWMNW